MKNENEYIINDEEFDLICKYVKIRYESKVSQRELAKKIGIAQSTIARMEKNIHSMSIGNFTKLLSALGYKLEIIEKEDQHGKQNNSIN
ncbi:MAG: helix-turn-helix transcriptional regulator [Bacilli bacterium]|nr:helix-turn-helix transcriptional regulator [Bacilli bacterium]